MNRLTRTVVTYSDDWSARDDAGDCLPVISFLPTHCFHFAAHKGSSHCCDASQNGLRRVQLHFQLHFFRPGFLLSVLHNRNVWFCDVGSAINQILFLSIRCCNPGFPGEMRKK